MLCKLGDRYIVLSPWRLKYELWDQNETFLEVCGVDAIDKQALKKGGWKKHNFLFLFCFSKKDAPQYITSKLHREN